jgi:hypothetical protein
VEDLHPSRVPARLVAAVVLTGMVLTHVFGYAIAKWWLHAGMDGPGQGLYFLFMLLPAALVLSIGAGLAVAWWRRGAGAAVGRAGAAAAIAMLLILAGLFAFEVWRSRDTSETAGQGSTYAAERLRRGSMMSARS